jgi:hypothetical protein
MRPRVSRTPFTCPVCGEELSADDRACPSCGACERSGWSQEAMYDGLDLPEPYDSEHPTHDANSQPLMVRYAWVVALVLIIALTLLLVAR